MTLVMEQATDLHGGLLIDELRPEDKAEIWALSRRAPAQVIPWSIEASEDSVWAVSDDDGLVCIFGLYEPSPIGGLAAPWMLGTRRIARHPRELMRRSREFLDGAFRYYGRLENYVSRDHTSSVRYLEALGFRFQAGSTPWGSPYYRFWKDRDHV